MGVIVVGTHDVGAAGCAEGMIAVCVEAAPRPGDPGAAKLFRDLAVNGAQEIIGIVGYDDLERLHILCAPARQTAPQPLGTVPRRKRDAESNRLRHAWGALSGKHRRPE